MNELRVQRRAALGFTPGELTWDGEHAAFTCEDVIREVAGKPVASWKVQNDTAIPAGRYQVAMDYSPRFGKIMPHVLNVPGFTGVRIHVGNTVVDTDGCLLVGDAPAARGVSFSTAAFAKLLPRLTAACAAGPVWITYTNPV